jgi:hypothetical protein
MPKAQLSFDLPEDQQEFDNAVKGGHYLGVIEEFDNYLRGRLKYEELTEEVHEALQKARDKLWEIRNDV